MKKILLPLLVLVGLTLTSCEDEFSSKNLIGKWSVQNVTYTEVRGNSTTTYNMPTEGEYYEFLSDGLYVISELGGKVEETGKWTLIGASLTTENSKEGTKINWIVKQLTSSKLSAEYSGVSIDGGKEEVVNYTYLYTFEKLK